MPKEEEFRDDSDDVDPIRGAYAVVHSLPDQPLVACTVFSEEDTPLGHRQWELRPDGIHMHCACSRDGKPLKARVKEDGTTEIAEAPSEDCAETLAPDPVDTIHQQMTKEVEAFADEWETRPIKYLFREGTKEVATRNLKLAGLWLDEDALDYAAATWYLSEGERLLNQIEEASGDLEKIKRKFAEKAVTTAFPIGIKRIRD